MFQYALRSVALILLTVTPAMAHAAIIEFDHIEYDPAGADSGHEWVRIHNVSGAPLDLTNWRLSEGGTNHKLRALAGAVIPQGGFAVIADSAEQYVADHSGTTDVVFDSAFSLSNTGETLELKNASSTIVASTAYTATPKQKASTPAAASKTARATSAKKSSPRILTKEPAPAASAAVADAVETDNFGFWPWLLGAVVLGVGAGGALWYVRKGRTESGYTVIDISDKSV